jgi:hypothetical protein
MTHETLVVVCAVYIWIKNIFFIACFGNYVQVSRNGEAGDGRFAFFVRLFTYGGTHGGWSSVSTEAGHVFPWRRREGARSSDREKLIRCFADMR